MIRRSFNYMDKEMLVQLYKGLVRPHLEYANVAWSPRLKKDALLLENVQHRATRLVPELAEMEYEDRLKALKLPSLMYRRFRGDLIETYKFFHGLYDVPSEKLLPPDTDKPTRGHVFKLEKQSHNLGLRKNFLSLRVTDAWNKLPSSIVTAPTINAFKNRIDKHYGDLMFNSDFPLKAHTSKVTVVNYSEDLQQAPGLQAEEEYASI